MALRNPAASAQTFTTTLREALEIPAYIHTTVTLSDAFTQSALSGLTTGTPIDIDTPLTLNLAASSVYIYNGEDGSDPTGIRELANKQPTGGDSLWYTLDGRRLLAKPAKQGVYINNGKKAIIK